MIAAFLDGSEDMLGYRWHFIKAIDPEGLALNGGWLKGPRTISNYLENFFRPALDRQPETTFPLDIPDARFDRSTPENQAWQQAFALTRPALHASLHHCDYGGGFFSLSRALPGAFEGLERALADSGFGVHDLDGDVMTHDQWTPAISRYPSVPELVASAKAAGASWAYPWTVGDMSPCFGEARYGTFTLVAEAPLWSSTSLRDNAPSGFTRCEQAGMLDAIAARATDMARRHVAAFRQLALSPDATECFCALSDGLKMMPSADAGPSRIDAGEDVMLTRHEFELQHTRPVLFALRTCGLLLSMANAVLAVDPDNPFAHAAADEARQAIRHEVAAIEARTALDPVPLRVFTEFQMQSIFACARALQAPDVGQNPSQGTRYA
jgi:hypothetical protein